MGETLMHATAAVGERTLRRTMNLPDGFKCRVDRMLGLSLALAVLITYSTTERVRSQDLPVAELTTFLERYCTDCHAAPGEDPEGGVALARDWRVVLLRESGPVLRRVLNAVEGHSMPPADMDQPTTDERDAASGWIRVVLSQPEFGVHRDPGKPLIRRLTRLEYNNTVRDLLGLETDVLMFSERLPFDKGYLDPRAHNMPGQIEMAAREYGARYPVLLPDAGLPADTRAEHGFTNRGEAQNLSAADLEQYFRIAREIAFHPDLLTRGERLQELFPGADFRAASTREVRVGQSTAIVHGSKELASNGNIARTVEGSDLSLAEFRQRLATAYEEDRGGVFDAEQNKNSTVAGKGGLLRVAYGGNANRMLAINPDEDLWIAPFATAAESSGDCLFCNRQKDHKEFVLTFASGGDHPWKGVAQLGVVVLSRRGQSGTVRMTAKFDNGGSKSVAVALSEGAGSDNAFAAFTAPDDAVIRQLAVDGSQFSGTHVLLDDLAFITRDSPPIDAAVVGRELPAAGGDFLPARQQSAGDSARYQLDRSIAKKDVSDRLGHFLRLAFRRRIAPEEVVTYQGLYQAAIQDGADDEEAMRVAVAGILSSTSFLYLAESNPPRTGRPAVGEAVVPLGDYELASRLSYFLWSSMPDDQLFALAEDGRLNNDVVLEQQVRRMLRDPRIRELSENYFVQWMRLQELWSVRPDTRQFPSFYSGPLGKRTLARDMFGEMLLLFETILLEDRSIFELIEADYAYLNGKLLDLYGFAPRTIALDGGDTRLTEAHVEDDRRWYRVRLPDKTRGGVLTSAAAMTLTSFPHRTSPIRRGAWFLEAIYNRPPPPPMIAVADIDEQEGLEGLSLREKVELHRAKPACAVCHDRIDPPGFALENFDAIGRWRERDEERPIDATGEIPGLGSFANPGDFKNLLLKQKSRLARGFAEHLLSYALGRELEYYDTATIEQIVAAAAEDDYHLSRFILEIVKSHSFRNKRLSL
jgi:hypothetical protein